MEIVARQGVWNLAGDDNRSVNVAVFRLTQEFRFTVFLLASPRTLMN